MWIKLLVGTTALTVAGAMPAAAQDSPQMDEVQLAQYGGYQPYGGPPPYGGYNPYYAQPGGPYGGPPQYGPSPQYGPPSGPQQYGSYGPPPGGPGPQGGPPNNGYNVAGAPPPGGQQPEGQPGYGPEQQGTPPGGSPQQSYDVAGVPQYGAPGSQPPGGAPGADYEAQPDVTVFTESTVAALKASLKLTADQEKNWGAFEAAARELAKLRNERATQLRELEQPKPTTASATPGQPAAQPAVGTPAAATAAATPAAASAPPPPVELVEGLTSEADALSKHATVLKQLAAAIDPLYKSLDDSQKQRFVMGAAPILPQNPPFHF